MASLFTFFEKVFAIFKFFTCWCLDVRPFVFYLFEVQSTVFVSFSPPGECFDLAVIFNKGMVKTLRYLCKIGKAVLA